MDKLFTTEEVELFNNLIDYAMGSGYIENSQIPIEVIERILDSLKSKIVKE